MTEHEELLMLRELVSKQAQEIQAKDQVITKQNIQIENMIQALLHAQKKLFGASTEISGQIKGQMTLFGTAQELARQLFEEQEKITIRNYTRTARKPGVRKEMLAGLPKIVEEYEIPAEDECSRCGGTLKVIGKEIVRTEVEFEPAKLKVKQIVRQVAKCTECGTDKSEYPKDHFQKAAVPKAVLSHSIATPALAAQVMYQKFGMGIPFARQERDWFCRGLVLSRGNMSNWTIRCSEEWLTPIYDRILEKLRECELLHMDETRIQCNKEKGKKASSE